MVLNCLYLFLSSSSRLTEDYDLPPHPSAGSHHGRSSVEEQKDSVAPLVGKERFVHSNTRKMLISTHSDADSAVSMVRV